ncbi:NusG domain II-containing protein [Eubacteriales bacterium OttesenSCG-928-A19]|nr:NusG domain II-containing protein [Eubacteriales bacterium OttesenSCG-928-A19]
MFKRKDILVLIAVVALAAGLLAASRLLSAPGSVAPQATLEVPSAPETGVPPQLPAPGGPAADAAPDEAAAYLLVTVRGMQYEPIPLDQEADLTLRKKETGDENVIHITPESVGMASSTCDNQDCVEQGTITLQNRHTRILQNMIICLPNEVILEMVTADEVEAMLVTPHG